MGEQYGNIDVGKVVNGLDSEGVVINSLNFSFPGYAPLISDFSLDLPKGSRCLLVGANGSGKTTLLQILAGKYMVSKDMIRVLGRPPFHDMKLTCDGDLSFLGSAWRRDIAFAGYDVPLQGDIGAGEMIMNIAGVDENRRDMLIQLLDIDLDWRMNKVSDGQRRRVQICIGLLKPYQVLLLDEITVDMDVVGRLDLLYFFEKECEERGAIIIYATHIFDGLEKWITHCAFISDGKLMKGGPTNQVLALNGNKLLRVVEQWLREDREERRKRDGDVPAALQRVVPQLPSKHLAFMR
eukprot:TRINITY_DN107975_c0_g1_i1.p2 TRINITY_DN107975_c0_g1~~TRINITY_DN107975_c0_g1_i1.p2  ORF type:complete len:295 (+),score=39.39 TRINITY_DN107975_c0_g1_i1:280-1164(+)